MTSAAPKELSAKTLATLTAIMDNPGKTAIDIAALESVSLGAVSGGVSSLRKAGLITVDEDGKLHPTDEATFEYGGGAGGPATPAKVAATDVRGELEDDLEVETAGASTGAAVVVLEDADTLPATITAVEVAPVIETAPVVAVEEVLEAEPAAAPSTAPAIEMVSVGTAVAEAAVIAASTPTVAKAAPAAGTAAPSKAALARAVFEANKDQPRKVLMALLMGPEVGLSINGANTYLHNIRKQAGLVKPRAAAGTTPAAEAAPVVVAAPAYVPETVVEVPVAEVVDTTGVVEVEVAETAPE